MKIPREERGQATIFMAVFMALLMLGFLALALDVGYMFHQKRMAQSAADAAAVAAAEEYTNTYGNAIDSANVKNAANVAAAKNGMDTTDYPVTLTPLTAGNYSNSGGATAPANWVQAVVSQPIHTFFLGAFIHSMRSLTVSASAIAGGGVTAPSCICLLGKAGDDLDMSNNFQLAAGTNCAITADSNSDNAITIVGSASVCAKSVGAVSTTWDNSSNINNNGSICKTAKAVQGAAACASHLVEPPLPNGITCYDDPVQGWILPGNTADYTLPMQGVTETNGHTENEVATRNTICYNSLDLSQAHSVTFQPGYTYYIKGNFSTGGGETITGSNVTFNVKGNVSVSNGVKVNLSAPTTNNIPGTLFYVDGTSVDFEGGSGSTLDGTIDATNATVTMANGTGTATMDIIAQRLVLAGGAKLNTYYNPDLGTTGAASPALSQ